MKHLPGPWTVWDTGFGLKIAPAEPLGHPHINMAVQLSAVMSFPPPKFDDPRWDEKWKQTKDKAWRECNKLNKGAL